MAKAPTITAGPAASNDGYAVSEDQAASGTIKLNVRANDSAKSTLFSLDDGQTTDLSVQDGVLAPQTSRLGATIAITADGQVSYTNNSAAVQALAPGQSLQDSFLYAIRLQNGSLVWQTVTVTITGANDGPVAVADVAAVAEDAVATGSVAGNDRDADNGAVLTFATTDRIPAGFAMASNGSWAFDGSNAAYQALGAGETKQFVIQYWVTDQYGASSSSSLTLTVTGTNDGPLAAASSAVVDEDQIVTGRVAASDAEGDQISYALVGEAPAGFSMAVDGTWTLDASHAAYQGLGASDFPQLAIGYVATDAHGANSTATLTVTVRGANDAPTAGAVTGEASEDSAAWGALPASDRDADSAGRLTYELIGEVPAGLDLGLTPDGVWAWRFNGFDPGVQSLDYGFHTLSATYRVTDQYGASATSTITLSVRGQNDGPSAAAAIASVSEDGSTSGQLGVSDPDAGDSLTVTQTGGNVAGFSLATNGSWTFDAYDYTYQALAQGQTQTLAIGYRVADEYPASASSTLTITVTGTNDAPVTTSQWFEAAEGMNASGSLHAFDPDNGADLTFALAGEAPEGFELNEDGSWTFDGSNPAYDHIAGGGYVLRYVPFTVTDELGASIFSIFTLSVTGTNDPAVITGDVSGTVVEDAAEYMIGGNLDANDPDDGDNWQWQDVTESANGYGAFTMDGSGGWLYAVDNSNPAVDALNSGETLSDSFVVRTVDGTAQTVSITINGTGSFAYVPPPVSTATDPGEDSAYWNADYVNYSAPRTINGTLNDDRIDGTNYGDTITGRDGYDLIYAHDGDDLIYGDVSSGSVPYGNDRIYGQGGNDTIIGGSGSDVLYGGSGSDVIYGNGSFSAAGTDSDVLFGGSGNDYLYGSDNGDRFTGGLGADYLYGGGGRDWFQFQQVSHTGDTIADFQQGLDSIVIVDLRLSKTNFIGELTEAGKVEGGQVGYFVKNGVTTVYIDTDGELGADLEIQLTGTYALTSTDFIWA